MLGQAPVRIEAAVADHSVRIEGAVHALEGVPEAEHARVGGRLGGRVPGRSETGLRLVGEAPDRRSPRARRFDRRAQLPLDVDVRAVLDGCREGAVYAPREHGPDVDVVAALVVPQKAVVRPVRTHGEAARALPPRDRDAASGNALCRRARREIRHAGCVGRARLRRRVLTAVDRAGLVPAPHERAVEPAAIAPEREHLVGEVRRPGLGRPCGLAGARGRRALRAERQPHRAEGVGALGRHARRGRPEPAAAVPVALRPRRAEAPVSRAHAVLGEEGVEAVDDARPAALRLDARARQDCGKVRLRLDQEERAECGRIVPRRHLDAEHAQPHRNGREAMAVAREIESALVDAGRRGVGHAEAEHEGDRRARTDLRALRERWQRVTDRAAGDLRVRQSQHGEALLQQRRRARVEPHGQAPGDTAHDHAAVLELSGGRVDSHRRARARDLDTRSGGLRRLCACRDGHDEGSEGEQWQCPSHDRR